MANTALNVTLTAANTSENLQQTLTDLNPAASNAQLKSFAQAFYGLSDDTYVDATRVDKTDVDTEDSDSAKFRDITVTGAAQGATATITMNIIEGETSKPAVFSWTSSSTTILSVTVVTSESTTVGKFTVNVPSTTSAIYVGQVAKNGFYADFVAVNLD